MVQSMSPENENGHNTCKMQTETTTLLTGDKRPMKMVGNEEVLPLQKRWKSSSSQTTNEWSPDNNELLIPPSDQYNLLNEPGPLGLKLKKSPSFLELIQATLSRCKMADNALRNGNLQVENKKKVKAKVAKSGLIDKLKASNFLAVLLRIGKWEYVSQHEGDLVGKCYFAKHKIVWEVLDGGLKYKMEIQWADIVGLNANFPDNGPGSITIKLGKQPLFFKETNPQPKKHTIWQATTDFTNGEASTYRQHYLQCAQGVLNKHYEKLIQCDTRLNFLSQQLETVSDLPFAPKNNGSNDQLEISQGSNVSGIKNMGTLNLAHGDFMKEYGYVENSGLEEPKTIEPVNIPGPQRTKSRSDLVNHIGHFLSKKNPAGVLPFFENVSGGINQNDMLENISQILLYDTNMLTDSDEKNLMSRVNLLCNLIQDGNDYCNLDIVKNQSHLNVWHDVNDYPTFDCKPTIENEIGMSRKDSFADLLHQLPRIASLPRLSYDFSEDGKILNR